MVYLANFLVVMSGNSLLQLEVVLGRYGVALASKRDLEAFW